MSLYVGNSYFLAVSAQPIFIIVAPQKYDQMSRCVYYAKNTAYFCGSRERDPHCNITSFVSVVTVSLKAP